MFARIQSRHIWQIIVDKLFSHAAGNTASTGVDLPPGYFWKSLKTAQFRQFSLPTVLPPCRPIL